MAADVKIPAVGESITEVIIAKWLKAEGSQVARDEPLVTLETDKVNVEVTAAEAGTLTGIKKNENDTAQVGEVIARIETGGAQQASTKQVDVGGAADKSGAQQPESPACSDAGSEPKRAAHDQQADSARTAGNQGRVMPAAQRLMTEAHIDRSQVCATGPGGRVLKEDVQRVQATPGDAHQQSKPEVVPAASHAPQAGELVTEAEATSTDSGAPTAEHVVPMSPLRRRIAERLVQAQHTAAILTTFNEVDMTAVMQLRREHQERFVARYGCKLGFMSFFVKACIDALRLYPEVNAEIRGQNIVYRNFYDIGVAVGGAKSLVVPVVRRAELLSFAELEGKIAAYGAKAAAGKLTLEEMQGGTFTISNGGVYGSMMSTPILNPPQSGILGMHAIIERPVGVGGKIELRPMMYVALSYDHRIVDGRGAVSFLKRIKECIEAPQRMLIEI